VVSKIQKQALGYLIISFLLSSLMIVASPKQQEMVIRYKQTNHNSAKQNGQLAMKNVPPLLE
jgi:hypothetical protein